MYSTSIKIKRNANIYCMKHEKRVLHIELFNEKLNNNELNEEKMLNIACELKGKVIGEISVWYTVMRNTVEIGFVFNPVYSGRDNVGEAVWYIYFQNILFIESKRY